MRFPARLRIPKVLTGSDIHIPIKAARVQVLPGRKTKMWTYAGTFPGPTIRRPSGSATRVTFHHGLPRKAGELTVHLHGGHSRSRFDGQPGGLTSSQKVSFYCQIPSELSPKASGNDLLIKPGHSKTYLYDLVEGGDPERAAFQWYHDHRLDRTGRNVWKGLAGMFILDDSFEADHGLDFPSGGHDIPLLVADRSLDGRHQLTNPFSKHLRPPNDGVKGKYVLLNGVWRPHLNVAARRYRLRLLNASNFRAYNFALGVPMVQIATESGLMPKAVKRNAVLLGPAERAEVIVDFTNSGGKHVVLHSVKRADGVHAPGTTPFTGPLMQFRVGSPQADSSVMPSDGQDLRPLPLWTNSLPGGLRPAPDKTWTITIGGSSLRPTWLINGRTFNPAHVEHKATLDTTEIWKIHNKTSMAHVFHIHSTDWYLISRNGKPPPPWEDCLKESFFIKPNETIYVAGHFSNSFATGKYVVHCHMLDHEDHGLMNQFEIVSA